jgi:hypothetical protein
MGSDTEGRIYKHQRIVTRIFSEGPFWEKEDES